MYICGTLKVLRYAYLVTKSTHSTMVNDINNNNIIDLLTTNRDSDGAVNV